MDGGRFDAFTRGLGTERSRRSVVKLLGAATLGVIGVAGFRHEADAAKGDKVTICHRTGNSANPYVSISVSSNAIPAHTKHGDIIDPDFSSDILNCGGCGITCDTPENGTASCFEGSCVSTCQESVCPGFSTPGGACYWLSAEGTYGIDNCWYPVAVALNKDYDQDECDAFLGCGLTGGCYEWMTTSC